MRTPDFNLRISLVRETSTPPTYSTYGASGLDIYADHSNPCYLTPGEIDLIPSGVIMEIPEGYEGNVRPRSGLAKRHGVVAIEGTIDCDYRGEIGVLLGNFGANKFWIEPGMKIAQIVIQSVARVQLVPVSQEELTKTGRGDGGFGSTGV